MFVTYFLVWLLMRKPFFVLWQDGVLPKSWDYVFQLDVVA
jgi:hypothetical protein